jgi:hypothetical protein
MHRQCVILHDYDTTLLPGGPVQRATMIPVAPW